MTIWKTKAIMKVATRSAELIHTWKQITSLQNLLSSSISVPNWNWWNFFFFLFFVLIFQNFYSHQSGVRKVFQRPSRPSRVILHKSERQQVRVSKRGEKCQVLVFQERRQTSCWEIRGLERRRRRISIFSWTFFFFFLYMNRDIRGSSFSLWFERNRENIRRTFHWFEALQCFFWCSVISN